MHRSLPFIAPLFLVFLAGCTTPQSEPSAAVQQAPSKALQPNALPPTRMKPADQRAILNYHNKVRADVGVGPLRWDNGLAAFAQQWADHLASTTCKMQHRQPNDYGENLYQGTAGYYTAVDAAKGWETEKKLYRGGVITENNYGPIGHYTQMVWRDTKRVGCGEAICDGTLLVACNYDPPGNWLGKKPY